MTNGQRETGAFSEASTAAVERMLFNPGVATEIASLFAVALEMGNGVVGGGEAEGAGLL